MVLLLPEAAPDGIVQGAGRGTGSHQRDTAQQPENAQKHAVGDLGHGDHQGVFGIEKIAEHTIASGELDGSIIAQNHRAVTR